MNKKQKICLGTGIAVAWLCYVAFLFMGRAALASSDIVFMLICLFVIALITGCLFFAFERRR